MSQAKSGNYDINKNIEASVQEHHFQLRWKHPINGVFHHVTISNKDAALRIAEHLLAWANS